MTLELRIRGFGKLVGLTTAYFVQILDSTIETFLGGFIEGRKEASRVNPDSSDTSNEQGKT